jgi:hypothetical protein
MSIYFSRCLTLSTSRTCGPRAIPSASALRACSFNVTSAPVISQRRKTGDQFHRPDDSYMRNYGVTFLIYFHESPPIEGLLKRLLLKVVMLTEVYEQLDCPASSLLGCPHEGRPTVAVTRVQVRAVLQAHSKQPIKSVGRRSKNSPQRRDYSQNGRSPVLPSA